MLQAISKQQKKVREISEKAGIKCDSYGSYLNHFSRGDYRVLEESDILPYIQTTEALVAKCLKIWAGWKWSWEADEEYFDLIVKNSQLICDLAKEKGITIAFEYHRHTLTDTRFAALHLIEKIKRDNAKLYWQYNGCITDAENIMELKMVTKCLENVHVGYCTHDFQSYELSEGYKQWKEYTDIIRSDGKDHNMYIEGVKDGTFEQFRKDAKTLLEL